jgi:hypothetical protein
MRKNRSTHAIVIKSFDVYFIQTDVEVTEDENSKTKEAFYDIVSSIDYALYNEKGFLEKFNIKENRFHSSRLVLSGLLAVGPNIVMNESDAKSVIKQNVKEYLKKFFPSQEERFRLLFVGKELNKIKSAVSIGDYAKALKESLRFVDHPNAQLAAKANYNCAILFEKMNEPANAKYYLQQSLSKYNLAETRTVMADYGLK